MDAAPDVSIILVSWNTRELLLGCLESLSAAVGTLRTDIWMVDNGSTDGSVAAVRERFPLLLLNSDTIAEPASIERLVRFADGQPTAGIIGARLLNRDGSFQASFADFPSLRSELLSVTGIGPRLFGRWYPSYGPRRSQMARRVDWIQGACMLARRAAIEQAGPMEEQYFMYNEEIDWCMQMWRAGWEVWYLPEARIVHYGGQSTRQIRHAMVQALYRSKVRFFRK